MRKIMNRKSRVRLIVASVVLALTAAAVSAEDVFVKYATGPVYTTKSARAGTVAVLKRGDKLQVLGREGAWLKVMADGKEGYIGSNSVATAQNSGGGGVSFLGSSGSESATAGAAAKGVDDSTKWAKTNSKSTAGLDRMEALRYSLIKDGDCEKFAVEGKVGTPKR
jgi:hypothetical protein